MSKHISDHNSARTQTSYFALILSGGRAARMDGIEKGLVPFNGRPIITQIINAVKQAKHIAISCNRESESYKSLLASTLPPQSVNSESILADLPQCFADQAFAGRSGPMAGVLSYFLNWQGLIKNALSQTDFLDADMQGLLDELLKLPVVVISSDMALMNDKVMTELVKQWSQSEQSCIIAKTSDRDHNLPFVVKLADGIELTSKWKDKFQRNCSQTADDQNINHREFSIHRWLSDLDVNKIATNQQIDCERFQSANTVNELRKMELEALKLGK